MAPAGHDDDRQTLAEAFASVAVVVGAECDAWERDVVVRIIGGE
ncbi:hypothetical protein [Kitasatospora sp. NPDC087314]